MAKYKGGYQLVSLLGVLVSASLSSTFNAKEMLTKIKGSNLKRIVLTDLVVNGEKKNDIEVTYSLDEENKELSFNDVYGFNILINYYDSIEEASIYAVENVLSLYFHKIHIQTQEYEIYIDCLSRKQNNIYNTDDFKNAVIQSITFLNYEKEIVYTLIITDSGQRLTQVNQYCNNNVLSVGVESVLVDSTNKAIVSWNTADIDLSLADKEITEMVTKI